MAIYSLREAIRYVKDSGPLDADGNIHPCLIPFLRSKGFDFSPSDLLSKPDSEFSEFVWYFAAGCTKWCEERHGRRFSGADSEAYEAISHQIAGSEQEI